MGIACFYKDHYQCIYEGFIANRELTGSSNKTTHWILGKNEEAELIPANVQHNCKHVYDVKFKCISDWGYISAWEI